MAPNRRIYAVRRIIMTIIATALCLTLWANDNQRSNQKEAETSLKRRRLLRFARLDENGEGLTYSSNGSIDPEVAIHEFTDNLDEDEDMRHAEPTDSTEKADSNPNEKEKSGKDVLNILPEHTNLEKSTTTEKPSSKSKHQETTDSPEKDTKSGKDSESNTEVDKSPGEKEVENEQPNPGTSTRLQKGNPNLLHKLHKGQLVPRPLPTSTKEPNISEATAVPFEEECTPPAYHEFPPDLFTHNQRAHGAVIVHICVIVYMFYAVAVVCDDYFVASLEECCARLNLSEDVAGATFMAAGSSAPELFTAILGVLVAKGDVGTGTIVGSAVFNVLFVIGICGIFSGRVVELTWWPLFRDSVFYSCTVIILIVIIFDSEVTWYESVIMMLIYAVYILLMKFNNDAHFWFSRRLGIEDDIAQNIGILAQGDKKNYSSYVPFNNEIDECASMPVTAHFSFRPMPADESIRSNPRLLSIYDAALVLMMTRHFRPIRRFRVAAIRIIIEQRRQRKEASSKMQGQISIESQDSSHKWKPKSISTSMGLTAESNWRSFPTREEGCLRLVKWIIQAPLLAVLHYTIPDCRKDKWKKFFLLTFFTSITWTAAFSYVMVWMVTLVGYTLGIPDSIMGITFLAAGTSVPDAFASLIVARQGQGDMAVSNSLGSNIFDILIGLAFPWFIQTTMVEPGSIAVINSRGMVYSVILLFLTIIITIGGIFLSQWQLTRRLGIVLLTVYGVFLVISVLLEFNLLGYVNPPMCQD
ncbi:sodium/potassium/calcium exchanger 3 [Parasteatoda tepidariorum]